MDAPYHSRSSLLGLNRNDSQQALSLIDAIPLLQGNADARAKRPDRVLGDRGSLLFFAKIIDVDLTRKQHQLHWY
jgi:hypothetical protein